MLNRGLSPTLSGLKNTNGLTPRDWVTCVGGNQCSLASRATGFNALQIQANAGNPTNFQSLLQSITPQDCLQCAKHQEMHTEHVHCTMEAGGNNGISAGPLGPIGPAFATCNGGVVIGQLVAAVEQDISHAINDLTNNHPAPPDAIGGASIATNHRLQTFTCNDGSPGCPDTTCQPRDIPAVSVTSAYFEPNIDPALLDSSPPAGKSISVPPGQNIGQNEGRLRAELRTAAKTADPRQDLLLAASSFANKDTLMGNAYADLSVTGSRSFQAFKANPPQESFCQSLMQNSPQANANAILDGCHSALNRAYRVANFLRSGQRGDTTKLKNAKEQERNALGWIAVSGEDDSPHRPVNVFSSDFPQFDLSVVVDAPMAAGPQKSVTVQTRYTIAQSPQLANGKTLVVISFDLPTSGYATTLDYNDVSQLTDIGSPKVTPLPPFPPLIVPPGIELLIPGFPAVLPPGTPVPPGTPLPDFQATGQTPLLDFIETFIVRFADQLDQQVPFKGNVKAVMGGSLGGNMTFRLGRRKDVPWMPKFVVWSPASIWPSLGGGADLFKHYGVRSAWDSANKARNSPGDGDRAGFFGSWDKPIVPLLIPQAQSDTWTSNFYLCKKSKVAEARLDRQETYSQNFLAWHWRLGAEQLLFSHANIDPATHQPLYMSNLKPMLLACGVEDQIPFNEICPTTESTALLMTMTPGKALFLDNTGHSLDNERQTFWAQQIIDFLGL
jgi:pimeloyl-ACP methyl ester carboxylesterase